MKGQKMSLDSVLSDKDVATEQVSAEGAQEPASEPEKAPEQAVEADNAADEQEPKQDRQVPLEALKKERKKRQELERQIAFIQGQQSTSQPQGRQGPTREELEDMFYTDPIAFYEKREQAFEQKQLLKRINRSERAMIRKHEDFNEMAQIFMDAARVNPSLVQEFQDHDSPAEYAYDWAKKMSKVNEYGGSIEAMEQKIRAKLMAEMEAEKKKQGVLAVAEQPRTQAGLRGSSANAAMAREAESLSDIVINKF
jgi:hypothetical protein